VTRYPRRDRAGNLIPWLSDFYRGLKQLQGLGLAIPQDRQLVAELGHALADQTGPTDPNDPQLAELVRQIQKRNQAVRGELTRTEPGNGNGPESDSGPFPGGGQP
jgi:hypothetical protein